MPYELHRIYMKHPTCRPFMIIWTQGWHYTTAVGLKEMLANVLTQTRVSDKENTR